MSLKVQVPGTAGPGEGLAGRLRAVGGLATVPVAGFAVLQAGMAVGIGSTPAAYTAAGVVSWMTLGRMPISPEPPSPLTGGQQHQDRQDDPRPAGRWGHRIDREPPAYPGGPGRTAAADSPGPLVGRRWGGGPGSGLGVQVPHDGEDAAVAVDVLQAVTRGKAGQHLARVVGRVSSAVRDWVRGVWDPGPILRVDRARWAAAASLSDMAELTAAWLRGQIASQPGYYGSCDVDEHLAPGMTDALVALCRAGAVTTGSQAGLVAGPVIQLAWVDAFVPDGLLSRLRTAARGSGYRVVVHTPASAWVTVTWEQDTARTSTGWVAASHWAWLYQDVGVAAVSELLATTHQVSIVDPQPGRNTLWSWLMDVLTDALVVDGVEPLDEDDDLCPDCDGPDRLVDCLTCFGAAADLDPGDLR